MNKGTTNGASNLKVVFGEMKYNEKDRAIEMPPKNAHEKHIEELKENMIEIVVNKNTRELIKKLEEQKGIEH